MHEVPSVASANASLSCEQFPGIFINFHSVKTSKKLFTKLGFHSQIFSNHSFCIEAFCCHRGCCRNIYESNFLFVLMMEALQLLIVSEGLNFLNFFGFFKLFVYKFSGVLEGVCTGVATRPLNLKFKFKRSQIKSISRP